MATEQERREIQAGAILHWLEQNPLHDACYSYVMEYYAANPKRKKAFLVELTKKLIKLEELLAPQQKRIDALEKTVTEAVRLLRDVKRLGIDYQNLSVSQPTLTEQIAVHKKSVVDFLFVHDRNILNPEIKAILKEGE